MVPFVQLAQLYQTRLSVLLGSNVPWEVLNLNPVLQDHLQIRPVEISVIPAQRDFTVSL